MNLFLHAQNNYTRVAAGINFAFPVLQKNYSTEPWKGIHIRSKVMEFGYVAGKVTNPSDIKVHGYSAYLGVNLPFQKFSFGKREYGIKGFWFAPFFAADLGRMRIDADKSFQITVAPGASIQLPYVLIDFRLNASFGLGNNISGLLKNEILLAPTVVFQFDALWDVMDPKLKFDGHYEGVNSSTSYSDKVEYTETEIITTTTATTTYSAYSYDSYKYDIGPHISVGPRICYWNLKKGGSTFMAGIVQSGRAHGFGYDLVAEKGNITSESGYDLKATRAMGRLSFDFGLGKVGNTHFTRLMLGAGLGYNWFEQSNEHVHSANGQFINLFVSYELGAVSFSYEINKAFNHLFEDQKYFVFTYRLPVERLHDRYKELKESK
jgi:hypothetical protein